MTALRHPLARLLALVVLLDVLALVGLSGRAGAIEQTEPAAEVSPTLAALLQLPAHVTDLEEPEADRLARLSLIADAIDAATDDYSERRALIALGWHESRFSSRVCEGHETGDRGKAWGCWQSWERDRSGGIAGQASRAVSHLRRSGNYCRARGHRYWRGAFSLYATGRHCDWAGADVRVRMMGGER